MGGNLNIEYLQYFIDVATTKSITQAAKLNFISPQGMSRAMNEFEKELDCELLIHYSNKLDLSPIGKALVPQVKNVIDEYNKLVSMAEIKSHARDFDPDSITIECHNIAMLAFFPDAARKFIFGNNGLLFRESGNTQIRRSLQTSIQEPEEVRHRSIGIVCFFDQQRNSKTSGLSKLIELGFSYRPYLATYDKVIISSSDSLSGKPVLSDEDILSRKLVVTNSYLYSVLEKRFGEAAIISSSANFDLRKRMVESGSCISFLPAIAELTRTEACDYVFRDFDSSYDVEIGFLGQEEDLGSPQFQKLVGLLDDFYKSHLDSNLYTLLVKN